MTDVSDGERLLVRGRVGEDSWSLGHIPRTEFALAIRREEGFAVHMRCWEAAPRAVNSKPDTPVYQDSCMECFLNLYPGEGKRYLNFEVNSVGAMLCQIGEGKEGRLFLGELGIPGPKVKVKRTCEYWEICCLIPFSLIQTAYGRKGDVRKDFAPGAIIKGNFYKCGDMTEHPHYGSWKSVPTEIPDFHQPDFFGEIEIRQ